MSFLEKNKWFGWIVSCLCSYLCILSLDKIISLHGSEWVYWGGPYFGYNITSVIIFGVTVWLFRRFLARKNKRLKMVSLIGGILLSAAVVYGAYAHYTNNIFNGVSETFLQLGMVIALTVLCAPVMSEIIGGIDRAGKWFEKESDNSPKSGKIKKIQEFLGKHQVVCFLCIWVSIFACHLPVFLSNWPGNFVFDARYQMTSYITGWHTTHHPLIHTLMMGKAYEFGQHIGNVSAGYQLYTLTQMLILSASFAYLLWFFYKKNVRRSFWVAAWCFFTIFPMHGLFAISATKDVLCAAFFLFFMVFLVRYICDRDYFGKMSYVGMVVSGILLSLFRNNALYAVLVAGVLLAVLMKGWKEKGKILIILVIILVGAKLVNEGLIHYTNAEESDTYRETMCVPLQSLGRVANYRNADLDPALYEEIAAYIPEEYIQSYNPYNADAVKNEANEELLKTNTLNFFKLWGKVGMQFPDEYIEGIVSNTMGYWYPLNQGEYVSADIALYHTLIDIGDEIEKVNYFPFYECQYRETPILGYLFRNAPYIWGLVVMVLCCLYKKDKNMGMISILPILYVLTCFCGPMAALRYIYCIIVCVPLFAYLMLKSRSKNR